MDLRTYQQQAQLTDQVPQRGGDGLVVPLLGMAGEVASLQVEYKKWLRDGPAHYLFRDRVKEELGDILWYVANFAYKFDLDLDDVAETNLEKTSARWSAPQAVDSGLLDDAFPEKEQLPRKFVAELREDPDDPSRKAVLTIDGERVGDPLDDNTYEADGYKFHDVFHLAHMTLLGWSPVMRKFLKRKRKSAPQIDNVEDGGRAIVIDEAVVAFVFEYARRHGSLMGLRHVDFHLLETIRRLTADLEVKTRSPYEWEHAILTSYEVWRRVKEDRGGVIDADLLNRRFVLRT